MQYFYLRRKEGEEKLKVPKNKDSANNYQSDISVKMYSVTKVQSLVSAKKYIFTCTVVDNSLKKRQENKLGARS